MCDWARWEEMKSRSVCRLIRGQHLWQWVRKGLAAAFHHLKYWLWYGWPRQSSAHWWHPPKVYRQSQFVLVSIILTISSSHLMTPSKPTILVLLTMFPHCGEYCPPVSPSPPRHLFPGNAHSNPRCHRFLSPLIMRSTFEGIHRRILITRALCGFVGCDQCRRAHVCHERPTSTILQFLQPAAVQTCRLSLRTFNIRCAMQNCTFGAPPGQY